MTIKYPAAIDDSISLPDAIDGVTGVQASQVNQLKQAILAIEAELGVHPASVYGTVRARLDILESALTGGGGGVAFNGDLAGNALSQQVIKINGATVPIAGSLTTGNVLQVTGSSSLGYAALTVGGDVSGALATTTVTALQTRPVASTAPTLNYVLKWNGSAWAPAAESTGAPNFFPFGPNQYLTAPPTIAGGTWNTTFNPVPNSPLGWAPTTIIDHPAGYGILITANGAGTHECLGGVFTSLAGNTTWTAQLDAPVYDLFGAGSPSPYVAMVIYDSVANRSVSLGVSQNGTAPSLLVAHQDYANYTTAVPVSGTLFHSSFPIWLQIFNDGTNYNFSYSFDGFSFTRIYQESRTAFLSAGGNYIGVGVQVTNSSNAGIGHGAVWLGSWSATSGFSPSSLSGMILWNRSDMGVTQSGTVTNWVDQSASANHFVPLGTGPTFNATDAQFNNLPSLNFNTSAKQIVTANPVVYGAFTMFMAIRMNGTNTGFMYEHQTGASGTDLDYLYGTTGFTTEVRRGNVTSDYNLTTNWAVSSVPRTIVRRFNGTHASDILRINGITQTLTDASSSNPGLTTASQTLTLMGTHQGFAGSTGTLAEIIVYNRALSDVEVVQVEAYMRSRYNYY